MFDPEVDPDLRLTAHRTFELLHSQHPDLRHQDRLREELMRRHQEFRVETTQRATRTFRPRLFGVKRLTLVAPLALASAAAASALVWALQISGHQSPSVVQASRITNALVRSAPTVVSWKVVAHQQSENATSVIRFAVTLKSDQQIYIRREGSVYHSYFFSGGRWSEVTDGHSVVPSSADWQFAFAMLPERLHSGHFQMLPGNRSGLLGIRYVLGGGRDGSVQATAWIDAKTGLATRLERAVIHGNRVVERDWADYRYTTRS